MTTPSHPVMTELVNDLKTFAQKHRALSICFFAFIPALAIFNSWLIWTVIHCLFVQQNDNNTELTTNESFTATTPKQFKHNTLPKYYVNNAYPIHYYSNYPDVENWIEQPFDHFDANENRTFIQRFYANNKYYKAGGPVFLFINGESEANPDWITSETKTIVQYAKRYKAMLYLIEHRYFGRSTVVNSTKTASDFQWLFSDQALADIVLFIRKVNNVYIDLKKAKWIAFGGSYAGSLSSWLREKYPNDVFAAVGSSGPLKASVGYQDYRKVVVEDMDLKVHNCSKTVSKAIKIIRELIFTEGGREILNQKFELYHEPLVGSFNSAYFFQSVFYQINRFAQYDIPALNKRCYQLVHSNKSLLDAYIEAFVSEGFYFDHYAAVESADDSVGSMVGWDWLLCNEFGWFTTTDSTQDVFGNTLTMDYFIQICAQADPTFSIKKLEHNVQETNNFYGGSHKFNASRVIQVYGTADPWNKAGLILSDKNLKNEVVKIVINGTNHCEDMYDAEVGSNPIAIQEGINQITVYLDKWIKN